MEIQEQVRTVMSHVFGVAAQSLPKDASPDNVEAWDSVGQMNLVLALEEEFGVQFTDVEMVEMLNLELVVLTVRQAIERSGTRRGLAPETP